MRISSFMGSGWSSTRRSTTLSLSPPYPPPSRTTRSAAGPLPRVERREEPVGEVALGPLVGPRHRVDGLPSDEDVALRGVVIPRHTPRPTEALWSCKGRGPAAPVHDAQLPVVAALVGRGELLDGLFGGPAFGHQIEAARAVVKVRHRLGGDGAHAGARPRHDGADGEEL